MFRKLRNLCLLFLSLLLFINCDNSNKLVDQVEDAELLVSGKWQRDNIQNGSGQSIILLCQKDDIYEFNVNGSYTINVGNVKCEIDDEPIITGTWLYNSATEILSMELEGYNQHFDLIDIDDGEMVLFQEQNNKTYRTTFVKQD